MSSSGSFSTWSSYHIVDGPVGGLGFAEAIVRAVVRGQGEVLAGAGKQQLGVVEDDRIIFPVLMAHPATALHLQTHRAKQQ